MKIIVCIKQVPGSNKVDIDEITGVLKRDGAEAKMNPYDLYAVSYTHLDVYKRQLPKNAATLSARCP